MASQTFAHKSHQISILFLLLVLISSSGLWAQVITGTILGTVTDASGAVLSGATITAINVATGFSRVVTTGSAGDYEISFLPRGDYTVRVEHPGFKREERAHVNVAIGTKQRADFRVGVGDVKQEIVVQAEAPVVNSQSSEMGQVISNEGVTQLPLNGGQFVQLALLTPGTSEEVKGTLSSPLALSGFSFQADGARYEWNVYLLDGVPIRDDVYSRLTVSPSIDAIQEFRVHSTNYSAEFGNQGGAQVNISTKSGSNQFHGAVYEFLRNSVLDARNFFDLPILGKPPFRQNQFGASFGGPVRKDKTFFFGNYEGQRVFKGVTITAAVPTDAMREGNFQGMSPVINPVTGQPFPNNTITNIQPYAQALLQKIPHATSPGLGRNWAGFGDRNVDMDQFTIRLDHSITDKDLIFGRFIYANVSDLEPIPGVLLSSAAANPLRPPGFGQTTTQKARNFALAYTHIFSPQWSNEFRAGYNGMDAGQASENASVNFGQQFGFQGTNPPPLGSGYPVFTITGFSTFGDANTQLFTRNHDFTFHDDVAHLWGKHSLKFGGEYTYTRIRTQFVFNTAGQYEYFGVFTGNPFADFLLGYNSVANALTGDPLLHGISYRLGAYIQDDWRATSRLTVNLGLRYDLQPPYHEKDNKLANFAPEIGGFVIAGSPGHIHPSADIGRFPGIPFTTSSQLGYPLALSNTDYKDFAPRIGLAYSVKPTLILRGAYGLFYSNGNFGGRFGIMGFNPPFTGLKLYLNFDPTNLVPVQQSLVTPSSNLTLGQGPARDFPNGYLHQWNFSVQNQLAPSFMVEFAYVGSRGARLDGTLFPNQPNASPAPLIPRLKWPSIAPDVNVASPAFDSWYHGLIVRAEKRYTNGLYLNASYTFAKSLDTNQGSLGNASGGGQPQYSGDIAAEKGRSDFDIRHRVALGAVYDLPFGRGRKFLANPAGVVSVLVSGWQLNNILVAETGQSLTPLVPNDQSNTGGNNDRPNLIGDPNNGPRSVNQWFNVNAFQLQPMGTFGNAGRGIIDGPGYFTIDLSAAKLTKITEKTSLEFRAESFNLLNRPNFDLPSRVFNTPGFGEIFTAKDSRELQFALKFIF